MNDSSKILSEVLDSGILSGQAARIVQMHLALGAAAPEDEIAAGLCFMIGVEASAAKAYEHAIRLYECSIELGRRNADVHYNLGNALLNSSRFEDAEDQYTQALDCDIANSNAFFNRGLARLYCSRAQEAMHDFVAAGSLGCTIVSFGKVICDAAQQSTGFPYVLRLLLGEADFPEQTSAILWDALDERLASGCYFLRELTNPRGRDDGIWWLSRCVLADAYLGLRRDPGTRVRELLELEATLADETGWHDLKWRTHYTIGVFANADTMSDLNIEGLPMDIPSIFTRALDLEDETTAELQRWLTDRSVEGLDLEDPAWQDRFALFEYAEAAKHAMLDAVEMTAGESIDVERVWVDCEDVFREGVRVSIVLNEPGWLTYFCETARATYQVLSAGSMPPAARERFLNHAVSGNDEIELAALAGTRTDVTLAYFTSEIVEDRLGVLALAGEQARCVEQAASIKPFRSSDERSVLDALLLANDFWSSPGGRLEKLQQAKDKHPGAAVGILERAEYGAEPKTDDPMFEGVEDALFRGVHDLIDVATQLTIVPYNYLQNIPFVLFPSLKRLVSEGTLRSLTYAPSAKILQAARTMPPSPRSRCLFVGYSQFDDLDIAGEHGVVESHFEHTTSLLNETATFENVMSALATHDIVHFCCHGMHDVNRDEPFLQLADENLYPDDLLEVQGGVPSLVVANACISAVSPRKSTNGDQTATLHAAWLMIGAKNVIGSQWRVNDEVAVSLCDRFYEHYLAEPTTPAASALMTAQREIRQAYPDDALWAPFVCYGANN